MDYIVGLLTGLSAAYTFSVIVRALKKRYLAWLFNRAWKLLDFHPLYNKANYIFTVTDGVAGQRVLDLMELEAANPALGLYSDETGVKGLSVKSLISTMADIGFGARIAWDVDMKGRNGQIPNRIQGWSWTRWSSFRLWRLLKTDYLKGREGN